MQMFINTLLLSFESINIDSELWLTGQNAAASAVSQTQCEAAQGPKRLKSSWIHPHVLLKPFLLLQQSNDGEDTLKITFDVLFFGCN